MSVEWVGAKPRIFINNSVVTPIDANNMNSIVNTVDKIAVGGTASGLDAATITGKSLDALITPSDEGLVAFYSFDAINGDTTQDLDDDSGNGRYGTLYNGVSEKGVIGKAISFNGTNAYAKGTYPDISQLTISLWYKGTNTGVNEPLFLLKKASNATKLRVYVDEGYAICSFTDADNVVQELSGCLINDNVYHQITITHSGSKCSVYCDGQLVSSVFLSLTTLYYNEWVLCANEALSNFTAASIDDVRIYNCVLSANEIYGQYITKISTKVPSKTPYYTADEIALVDQKIDLVDQKHSVIDNTSRVCQINGDGVPTFPDNVAGRTYWQDYWATTDGWFIINGTSTVSGGALVATATGNPFGISKVISGSAGSVIRVKIKASISVTLTFQLTINGVDTWVKAQNVPANLYQYIDIPATSAFTRFIVYYTGATAGNTISLDTIYIGSGLYDTPVYDKAGCNRATNYGVLPVKGTRGQALSFNGGSYLQFDNPVIGTTGTIAFKLKDVPSGVICWNESYNSNGIGIFYASDKILVRLSYSGGNTQLEATVSSTGSFVLTFINGDIKLYRDTMIIATSTFANITAGTNNLKIGREVAGAYLTGVIGGFRYDSRIWTQSDVTRYNNGDDAVDSQQKSNSGTPHALAVYNANGFLGNTTPMLSLSAGVIGATSTVDVLSGGTLTIPSGSGYYAWIILTHGVTINSATTGYNSAGATVTGTASGNCRVLLIRLV